MVAAGWWPSEVPLRSDLRGRPKSLSPTGRASPSAGPGRRGGGRTPLCRQAAQKFSPGDGRTFKATDSVPRGEGGEIIPRTAAALLVCTLFLASFAASLVHDDDAGTRADASDSRADPTPLASYGSYLGNLSALGDADWYSLPGGASFAGPYCVEAEVAGAVAANLTLAVDAGFARHEVTRRVPPLRELSRIGIALPPVDPPLAGLTADGPVGAAGGSYALSVRAFHDDDFGPGDAGTGGDAPGTLAGAPLLPRACIAGALNGSAGDERDVIAFEAQMGERFVLSFLAVGLGATPRLEVLDAAGLALLTLDNTTLDVFEAPATGVYYLSPTTSASGSAAWWAVGVTDDAGGQGCRPMCLA